ncbi:MAG: hypothetical protein KatS3mg124_1533 [Porticoccaceae bacterium]|nr:MAG: hypothetical protein KatS3mg124_1533 [Porticoccaceae bacterium]
MAHTLDKAQWKTYFDNLTKHLGANLVEIEVASLAFGDQIESEWVPLIGVDYDPKDDLIEVAVEGLDHQIHHPVEVVLEDGVDGVAWIAVADRDGNRQVIRFRKPLALPKP